MRLYTKELCIGKEKTACNCFSSPKPGCQHLSLQLCPSLNKAGKENEIRLKIQLEVGKEGNEIRGLLIDGGRGGEYVGTGQFPGLTYCLGSGTKRRIN